MQLLIFDIDGTLANTKTVEDRCFMKAFQETFGLDIFEQDWSELKHVTDWGITEEIIQNAWNRKPTKVEYELMIRNFVQQLETERAKDARQFQEVAGAKAFFDRVKNDEKYSVGIATGSWEQSALIKLDCVGISVNEVAFSNSNHFKSRADITQHAIEQARKGKSIPKEQITYFGDGVWDFKTCQQLGINFIGIDVDGEGKLEQLGAEKVFRDFKTVNLLFNL